MKRNIINTSVTDEAKAIYDSLPPHRKGHWVSNAMVAYDSFTQQEKEQKVVDAFITKHERDTGTGIQVQVDDLRMRVEKLEGRGRDDKGNI